MIKEHLDLWFLDAPNLEEFEVVSDALQTELINVGGVLSVRLLSLTTRGIRPPNVLTRFPNVRTIKLASADRSLNKPWRVGNLLRLLNSHKSGQETLCPLLHTIILSGVQLNAHTLISLFEERATDKSSDTRVSDTSYRKERRTLRVSTTSCKGLPDVAAADLREATENVSSLSLDCTESDPDPECTVDSNDERYPPLTIWDQIQALDV